MMWKKSKVSLRERVDVKPGHEALVATFTDCLPLRDCADVVEPRIMFELDFFQCGSSSMSEKNIVPRTLATSTDCSVAVQVANPSSCGVALHCCIRREAVVVVARSPAVHRPHTYTP